MSASIDDVPPSAADDVPSVRAKHPFARTPKHLRTVDAGIQAPVAQLSEIEPGWPSHPHSHASEAAFVVVGHEAMEVAGAVAPGDRGPRFQRPGSPPRQRGRDPHTDDSEYFGAADLDEPGSSAKTRWTTSRCSEPAPAGDSPGPEQARRYLGLDEPGAAWLVARRVKAFGVGSPGSNHPLSHTFSVHRMLRDCGVTRFKQLANLASAVGRRSSVYVRRVSAEFAQRSRTARVCSLGPQSLAGEEL